MERLLIERFYEEENIPTDDPEVLLNLIESCNRDSRDSAVKYSSVLNLVGRYVL